MLIADGDILAVGVEALRLVDIESALQPEVFERSNEEKSFGT